MSKKDIDELVRWRDKCEEIARMLQQAERERDEARAEASRRLDELNMVQSQLTRALTDRDNLRAEITKAQESFDDDGPSGWMPGETTVDALIRTRDEARADAANAFRRGAEAMREACAQWFREHDESFELTVDACHEVIADMAIPEDKP